MIDNLRELKEKLLDILSKSKGYLAMLLNIFKESGTKAVLQTIKKKIKKGFNPSQVTLSIQDWLSYYQKYKEIAQEPMKQGESIELPKISIIILTYNNLAISQICLQSIFCNTTYPNFEVIVVDNASNDKTPNWLKAFSVDYHNMRVILNKENLGFAGGNNQAARLATGDFLVFLNNDTVVTKWWLERLLNHINKDPNIGLIGPVTNSTGNEARIPVNYRLPNEMEIFAETLSKKMAGRSFDIRMLAFYCVMTRKNIFEALGGLDERYAVGMFEDDDMARRCYEQGYRVVCAEDVFIHHFQGASFGKLEAKRYNRLFEDNKRRYEEKWGGPWQPYKFRENHNLIESTINIPCGSNFSEMLIFQCNICGQTCKAPIASLEREKQTCVCGSTVRSRTIVHILSTELFGRSIALPDFPVRFDLHGWGMSDAGYCDILAKKMNYVNTFYHKEPYLDILSPIDPEKAGKLDFLISTEVFEHIAPPVSIGFENAKSLLKPSGFLLLTVPFTLELETREHFPELYKYSIKKNGDNKSVLENITIDGRKQVFENLVFHGGPGTTLEMRVFSKNGLMNELKRAGFKSIKLFSQSHLEFGIYWHQPWSLPLIARKVPPSKHLSETN